MTLQSITENRVQYNHILYIDFLFNFISPKLNVEFFLFLTDLK